MPHALQFGNKDDYDAEGHEIINLQNISMDDVEQFLAENWLAGTFKFTHLTTSIDEIEKAREGRVGFSYDECLLLAETNIKQSAFKHFIHDGKR